MASPTRSESGRALPCTAAGRHRPHATLQPGQPPVGESDRGSDVRARRVSPAIDWLRLTLTPAIDDRRSFDCALKTRKPTRTPGPSDRCTRETSHGLRALAGGPGRDYRGGVARSNDIIPITGAQVPLSEDQRQRTRRYLISMAIRTVCFIAAIIATGWLRWTLVAGAVFLPYVAVVMANAGRGRSAKPEAMLILNDQRQIGSHRSD